MIPSGDEEEWTWIDVGISDTHMAKGVVNYEKFPQAKIGVRDGGKISVLECAKISVYWLPLLVGAADAATTTQLWLSSTGEAPPNVDTDVPAVNKLCRAGGLIWLHQVISYRKIEFNMREVQPTMYDVETHDGHGLLITCPNIYVCTRHFSSLDWGIHYEVAWRLLVRQVWVDPAYYLKEQAANVAWHARDA